jgi:ectoine hydroxylase-related dioxygenase (phytanoyl-CoA dioxygenase family)
MLERVVAICRDHAAGRDVSPALVVPEARGNANARFPEDLISKVFRLHRDSVFEELARDDALLDLVAELLGPDVDCFLSQFILKTPGAYGQPWHQDALYFPFEPDRQLGVWLAVSEATLANGCLHVLPGSHREPVHAHVKDARPGSNYGYLEIVDHDMASAIPVPMQPGDLLVFHSHLMHRSTDNESDAIRAAMVYHYSPAGTVDRAPRGPTYVNDWMPVRRAAAGRRDARERVRPVGPSEERSIERSSMRAPHGGDSRSNRVSDLATDGLPAGARLHPWNRGFRWQVRSAPLRVLTPAQNEQFDREGFLVLEEVLDPEEVAATVAEIDPFDEQTEAYLRTRPDGRLTILETGAITFSIHLVTRSPRLRALAAHPAIAGICHDLVGNDVNLYWDQAVYKKPEKPRRFPWHQDNGYTYVEPQQYLTCWVALTDATEQNGCPWVAPGLHALGTLAHRFVEPLGYECFEAPERAVAAPVRAGGIVVFSSLTPHLTGPNTSGDVRKAYILQYAPAGARILEGNPNEGPPTGERPCDLPERQFAVLRGGVAVAPPR